MNATEEGRRTHRPGDPRGNSGGTLSPTPVAYHFSASCMSHSHFRLPLFSPGKTPFPIPCERVLDRGMCSTRRRSQVQVLYRPVVVDNCDKPTYVTQRRQFTGANRPAILKKCLPGVSEFKFHTAPLFFCRDLNSRSMTSAAARSLASVTLL